MQSRRRYSLPGTAHYRHWGSQYSKADGASRLSVSVSHFLPNGGAEQKAVPELIYYVLSGSMVVQANSEQHILDTGDLVHFDAGEERGFKVRGQAPASLLVVSVAPS